MNVSDFLITDNGSVLLNNIFLSDENVQQCQQIIMEHNYIAELHQYELPVNNKILLHGSSGCGKTITAKAIAQALGRQIYVLNLSNIVSSRIGETSQNLKQVFDKIGREKAVLFLDEFDQIGKARQDADKDVGEMRRLVNTLIQLIDYFPENALLLCATNHPEIIDTALLRRFQVKLIFSLPTPQSLNQYYDSLLSRYPENMRDIIRIYDISFAEARDYTYTTIKGKLIATWEANKLQHSVS